MSAAPRLILFLLLALAISHRVHAEIKPSWPREFHLMSLDGKRQSHSADAFRGQPLLVQFWASWCRSCSGISSELEQIVTPLQQSGSSGLRFLSISIDETTEEARRTVQERRSGFLAQHSFHDARQNLRNSLKIDSVPTILLVARDGRIVLRKEGHLSASEYLEIKKTLSAL